MYVLRARLADPALKRSHQGGRFAANEGPRAARDTHVEGEVAAQDVVAEHAGLAGGVDGDVRVVQRQGVLVADVDITAPGADGVGADEHALQDRVRVALEDAAIHVGSRIAFVGVADDKPLVTWCVPAALPLPPGRESAAASAAQSGSLHLLDDLLRRQFGEHLREGAVATQGDVVLDRARIDELVLTQEHAVLCRVEGDLGLLLVRLAVMRVDVDEPLYHIVTRDRHGDDLAHILGRHVTVE